MSNIYQLFMYKFYKQQTKTVYCVCVCVCLRLYKRFINLRRDSVLLLQVTCWTSAVINLLTTNSVSIIQRINRHSQNKVHTSEKQESMSNENVSLQ